MQARSWQIHGRRGLEADQYRQPFEKRLDLSISTKGISDFGDGPKGYSPINLVTAAYGLGDDSGRAFMMLSEWLGRVPVFEGELFSQNEKRNAMILVNGNGHDPDTGEVFEAVDEPAETKGNGHADVGLRSAARFIDEYVPITYSVGGVLAEMALYFLTGRSGCGKTTIASIFGLAVATGEAAILGVPVESGRVAFVAFENPDNFRQQLAVAVDAHCPLGIPDNLIVIDKAKTLEGALKALAADAAVNGDYRLIIIDSFQASFGGDDFNNNAQT